MSISNITRENNFDLYCRNMTISNELIFDDATIAGDVTAHNVTADVSLNGKSVQLSGEELSPGDEMYQAVRLDKDTPLVFDVNTDTNTWSPAISFYGEENVDRSLYFYGGNQAGNQKVTDWQKECSMKINDNVVVQNGNLVLFQSPTPSTLAQRTTEKTISFNYGDDGLDGGQTCNIGMVGDSASGVQGNIIFRCQNDNSVPPSTLSETMRIKGPKVGILTDDPQDDLHVNGGLKATTAWVDDHCSVVGNTGTNQLSVGSFNMPTTNLSAKFRSPSASVTEAGQLCIEAGTDAGGDRAGWGAITWNGYLDGTTNGYHRISDTKKIWQMKCDQRPANDSFILSTITPTDPLNPQSIEWINCDGDRNMILNELMFLDAIPELPLVRPTSDNTIDLGYSSFRWKDVYAGNGTIQTSDETMKNSIVSLSEDKGLSYINKLRPVSFKFNDGGVRNHSGFIAQEVEAVMTELGDVDGTNNATVIKSTVEVDDPEYVAEEGHELDPVPQVEKTVYGLRYTEMIASLVKAVQELSSKNEELSSKNDELVARIEALESA